MTRALHNITKMKSTISQSRPLRATDMTYHYHHTILPGEPGLASFPSIHPL